MSIQREESNFLEFPKLMDDHFTTATIQVWTIQPWLSVIYSMIALTKSLKNNGLQKRALSEGVPILEIEFTVFIKFSRNIFTRNL